MYTVPARRSGASLNGVCDRCVPNDRGLGEDAPLAVSIDSKAIQKEYGGQSDAAGPALMGIKLVATVALMFIPVVGWAAALLLNVPVVGDAIMKPILGPIAKMFKKATHMESCMKWWTDSNIRSMASGLEPYPISQEIKQEYRLQHAKELVDSYSDRKNNIINNFVKYVRQNPDIMSMQCATMPQGRKETHMTEADAAKVVVYWSQIKEASRQQEYQDFVGAVGAILSQKVAAVASSRQAGLVTTATGGKGFQLPEGVMSISKGGALILDVNKSTNKVIDYSVVGKPMIKGI